MSRPGKGATVKTAGARLVAVVALLAVTGGVGISPVAGQTAPPPGPGAVPPRGLGPGDRGQQVRSVEDRLTALHYNVGVVDDVYDASTASAVTAFQKVQNLARTGRVTQDVSDALNTASAPGPLVAGGGPTRVEIDLPRQVLQLFQNDQLAMVLPVSTGSGKRYCVDGHCGTAITQPGSYRIGYHIPGWHR